MRRFAGYIFDLDGTIYLGEQAIPGAAEAVAALRGRGARVAFLSNKPIQTRERYAKKLTRLGIPTDPEDVITSSHALVAALHEEAPGARVYPVGERAIVEELRQAGFAISRDPQGTDFVILSFDRTFHYGKLLFAHRAVRHGARIWATNPDRTCPTENGDIPDCASMIAALEACTGRKVERVVGKPSPAVIEAARRRLGIPLTDCLMVGDRIETDIRMARDAGCPCALVLTGVTSADAARRSDIQADYVLNSVAHLTA